MSEICGCRVSTSTAAPAIAAVQNGIFVEEACTLVLLSTNQF
jgi:hypothetical protein